MTSYVGGRYGYFMDVRNAAGVPGARPASPGSNQIALPDRVMNAYVVLTDAPSTPAFSSPDCRESLDGHRAVRPAEDDAAEPERTSRFPTRARVGVVVRMTDAEAASGTVALGEMAPPGGSLGAPDGTLTDVGDGERQSGTFILAAGSAVCQPT